MDRPHLLALISRLSKGLSEPASFLNEEEDHLAADVRETGGGKGRSFSLRELKEENISTKWKILPKEWGSEKPLRQLEAKEMNSIHDRDSHF